ncbi:YegS/Rv2252/BmrU family lipid kinase [Nocardioides sp. KR10-350]|uniref:YegS/Rv2252/BmrU family lipid kinase n=1 Tax=Nocardioides cheoyonin TaxID=3156615 RepID=UPI0032B37850
MVRTALLDRSRRTLLAWAAVCFALFVLLGIAATHGWAPVPDVDSVGDHAARVTAEHDGLRRLLRVVEVVFDVYGILLMTLALVAILAGKHRRAAVFCAVTVVATIVVRWLLVWAFDRDRPAWQATQGLLESNAYPSGHTTSVTVLSGVTAVVVGMLVRRRNVRRTLYTLLVLAVLLVGADRVFLGRHYPSDVVGGVLLAIGMVLLGFMAYSPLPRSHAIRAEPLLEFGPRGTRLAVVLNPVKVESVGQFQAIVTSLARAAGWDEPTWHLTTEDDPGTGMAQAARAEGAELVLVCGGDGTVREVCAALAGTGIPVGIVPAGTGNLLARNLEIPLYIRAAIDVALTGQDRAVDLVEVSGDNMEDTHFMVMAGMGFDAAIMDGVNEQIKKRIGWLAYVLSALKSLMFPAMRLEISVDGGEFTRHRARTVVVGNVGYLQAGMPLLPDARIDDGLLDVVLLNPRKFLSWVPLAFRVLGKRSRTDDLVNRMTGRTVVVRASHEMPREFDGDTIAPGRELRMTCIHGRLLVRVPR